MNMIALVKNVMKVNLTKAVKSYKNVSIYECVNEAIVNSLQANSNKINIKIESKSANELFNEEEIISKITIQDNGDGFNEKNRNSFLHLYSDHKEEYGCKGVGRLSYLKRFQNVKISSKQNKQLVEFDFTKELDESQLNPKTITEDIKETILTLEEQIKGDETYNLDKIYAEIFNHIYPFIFLKYSGCTININNKKISKDDVKNIENTKFNVKKTINNEEQSIEFDLWYRFQESDKTILDDFICINKRPMQHFYNKPLSLKLHSKEKYHITFLLESDWINKLETNQYHKLKDTEDEEEVISDEQPTLGNMYVIEDLYKNEKLVKEIWQDVKQELIKKLNAIMNLKFPEIQNKDYSFVQVMQRLCKVKQLQTFKVASLFAGVGGIDLAFQNVGFKIEWANEIDNKACETYSKNFKHKIICDDIKNLKTENLSKIDILTGGFPCQAFSIAGHQKGFSDDRGSLVFELLRIVKDLEPRVLFLENVKNLKSHQQGKTLKHIINAIEKLGYKVKYQVMNTCEYSNIPQNRERVYIVCFKNESDYNNFEFPKKVNKRLSIQDILEKNVNESFYYNKTKYYELLKQEMKNNNTCYQWRRQYVRENKNNLCPTLTANMGTGGHNVPLVLDNDIRKLTPRECARLQGFPDSFELPKDLPNSALYKQMGNSVSVPVVEQIAKNILIALNS